MRDVLQTSPIQYNQLPGKGTGELGLGTRRLVDRDSALEISRDSMFVGSRQSRKSRDFLEPFAEVSRDVSSRAQAYCLASA